MQRFENTEYAKESSKIGDSYNHTLKEIRKDTSLSDSGKRAQMQDAYAAATARMDRLKQSTKEASATRVTTLQRRLFGTVGGTAQDAISHRDATDRAMTATTEDEALSMMGNAVASSDKVLQGAILKRAYDAHGLMGRPWMKVINTYEAAHSIDADDLQELLDLMTKDQHGFGRAVSSIIMRPAELGGWG